MRRPERDGARQGRELFQQKKTPDRISPLPQNMKILSIETSCDETAIALLEITGPLEKPEIRVLGNSLFSQAKLHEAYGGVYPNLAKREHQKNLPILLEKTLQEAGEALEAPELDFITVTTGPGLEPALWTGIVFAQELGQKWDKPVVGTNHMEGHIYSVLYSTESNPKSQTLNPKLALPALALLISGGHTELVYIKNFGEYEVIGRTLDDAVGEAFDKVARMLGLPYPGGPQISLLAQEARKEGIEIPFKFPRPMLHSGDLNFSFSGLKTAVLYKIKSLERSDEEFKKIISQAFEDAAIDVLKAKTLQACRLYPDVRTLIIAGGVSANTYLCAQFQELANSIPNLSLHLPTRAMATDNAVMIALASYIQVSQKPELLENQVELRAQGNLSLS